MIGNGLEHRGHLQERHRQALPDRQVGERAAQPVLTVGHHARGLALELDPGLLSETELLEVIGIGILADPVGKHQCANIRRLAEDPGGRKLCRPVLPGVIHGHTGHFYASGDSMHFLRIGHSHVDSRGRGDDLVHRARLERSGHRPVAQIGPALEFVSDTDRRVEGVVVRHRAHFAGLCVQDDGGSATGL